VGSCSFFQSLVDGLHLAEVIHGYHLDLVIYFADEDVTLLLGQHYAHGFALLAVDDLEFIATVWWHWRQVLADNGHTAILLAQEHRAHPVGNGTDDTRLSNEIGVVVRMNPNLNIGSTPVAHR